MHGLHEDGWLRAGEQFTILMSPHSPTTLRMNSLLLSTNVSLILLPFLSTPFPLFARNLQKRHITVPSIVWDRKPRAVRRNRGSLPGDLWQSGMTDVQRLSDDISALSRVRVTASGYGWGVGPACQTTSSGLQMLLYLSVTPKTQRAHFQPTAVSFHVCRI